jgi:hypothetical protein
VDGLLGQRKSIQLALFTESQRIVETSLLLALTIPSHNLSRLQMICVAPVLSCHVAQVTAIGAAIRNVFWSRAEAYIYATKELTLPLSSMDFGPIFFRLRGRRPSNPWEWTTPISILRLKHPKEGLGC